MRVVFDERTMLQRWLDVEAALAAAQEELGLIPPGTAEAIARAAKVETLDLDAVGRDLAVTAHPIVPLVRELARRAGDAGRWVHWGATTQDIMDTGMVLQLRARRTRSSAATSSPSCSPSPTSPRAIATRSWRDALTPSRRCR